LGLPCALTVLVVVGNLKDDEITDNSSGLFFDKNLLFIGGRIGIILYIKNILITRCGVSYRCLP